MDERAQRVSELLHEAGEVHPCHVIHPDVQQSLQCPDGELCTTEGVRGVDLVRAMAGDVDAQVAWDREVREAVPLRVGADDQDRVGATRILAGGERAFDELPQDLTGLLENVVLLIEDDAPDDDPTLLGLYDGIPVTERTSAYGGVLPDRITVYRNPTLAICDTEEDVVEEVAITVVHEIAHHFGIDDERLHELGWG